MSQCEIDGNSDLYGIGVRLGLYTQWAAQLLVTIFKPRNEEETRVVSLIVQSAIFLGICTESTHGGSAVGSVVTQLLLCGSLSSLTGNGVSELGKLTGMFRSLFYTALASYGIWFWFVGIDKMHIDHCETRDQVVFFGHVSITGGFRTFGKVVAVIGLVVSALFVAANLRKIWHQIWGQDTPASSSPPDLRPKADPRPKIEIGLLVVSVMLIGFSVSLVEYLVKVNDIQGLSDINSVGQFLPLLVGAISLFQALSSTLSEFRIKRCWFLLGHHL